MTRALTPDEARSSLRDRGAVIVDARPAPEFSAGHPGGSLCVPYSERGFATRIRVADPGITTLVLVTPPPGPPRGAGGQLDELGMRLMGYGPADPLWWAAAGVGWQTLGERAIDGLAASADTVVVDVREPMEWTTGHAPGAILIPLGEVHARADDIPRDQHVVLICEAGIRSATAASILQRAGHPNVSHAPQGTAGIRERGGALDHPQLTAAGIPQGSLFP